MFERNGEKYLIFDNLTVQGGDPSVFSDTIIFRDGIAKTKFLLAAFIGNISEVDAVIYGSLDGSPQNWVRIGAVDFNLNPVYTQFLTYSFTSAPIIMVRVSAAVYITTTFSMWLLPTGH